MINNASQMGGTVAPLPQTQPFEPIRPPPAVEPPPPRQPPPPRKSATTTRSGKSAGPRSSRSRDIESGAAPLLPSFSSGGGGGAGGGGASDEKLSTPAERKAQRNCSYLFASVCLQVMCALVTVVALLWITIQALRSVALFGLSQEPPGLVYANEMFEPSPPASPPQFLFGRL
jgi:hypothetical protein